MTPHHEFRLKIDSIKASVPLATLFERDGVKLTRCGALWKCCCPFHKEKTASCTIYTDGHFWCFGCAQGGDVFGYLQKTRGCTFKEAFEMLSGGQPLNCFKPFPKRELQRLKEPELPKDYFEKMWWKWANVTACTNRVEVLFETATSLGVSDDALTSLSMVVTDESNLAFPMRDHDGTMIGIRIRDFCGKKWAVKGSKQGLFIPTEPPERDLYVTEGPTDCAAMLSMGLYAIGKASAMQGPEEIVKFILRNSIRRVIVIADNDEAGLKGATKLIDVCPVPCAELVLPAKDAREFYRSGGTSELIENLLRNVVWRHCSKG